jgi:hypothetical protein
LKAKGQEKGEDAFDKRLAIPKELHGDGFVVQILVMVRLSRV